MTVLVLGGAGFVGLNVCETLLARARDVLVLDVSPVPHAALMAFETLPGRLTAVVGDVSDAALIARLLRPGVQQVVYGAAITADAHREASAPEAILRVNLQSLVPVLAAACAAGVRRVVNLSSAAVYGRFGHGGPLQEDGPADPAGLYGITKLASERVGTRLGELWGLQVCNLRLSAVFGPWERATGVRDTLSPHWQLLDAAARGQQAVVARPGLRDWVYSADVADAVVAVLDAPALRHTTYNVTAPAPWTVLDWGQRLAARRPGFECRLAQPGEAATINLHATTDRAALDGARLHHELGWTARHGLHDTPGLMDAWLLRHGPDWAER